MSEGATPALGQFLRRMGLESIAGFSYESPISGGGTNFTALFRRESQKAVAKFFFMGPHAITLKKFRNELDNHQRSRLISNVLPEIYEEFQSQDCFLRGYLMEYIEGESLESLIPSAGFGETSELHAAFYRVTWAYHGPFLAQVHGDLHPGNILFETNMADWLARRPESPEVRILDLGASISPYKFAYEETFDEDLWADHQRRFGGSFYSLAPEFLTEGYTRAMQMPGQLDCWSLGLLLYKMTTGKLLHVADSLGSYAACINNGRLQHKLDVTIDQSVSGYHLNALLKWMLRVDAADRINLTTATDYMARLYRNDEDLLGKQGKALREFVAHGCDPEWHLPPHERSNSPY